MGLLSRKNKKVLAPPIGGTRTELTNSAVPPCLPIANRPLSTVPTHRLPNNAGIASEDTRKSVLPALGGPFAAPLFALLSALRDSLWMRLQLYFRVFGLSFELGIFIHQNRPFVKNFFSCQKDEFNTPGRHPLQDPESGRWCRRWGNSSRFRA